MNRNSFLIFLLVALNSSILFSKIDSQWRGPNRNGNYPETNLLKTWPTDGPKQLLVISGLGTGFSSPAVTENKILITGMLDKTGYLFAYDLQGKLLWKSPYGSEWSGNYPGSRSTPTVVGQQVYCMSGMGQLSCFDVNNGKQIWSIDILKTFNAPNIEWGITESLLIDGENIICTPGGPDGNVVALNRMTGKTVWKSKGYGEKSAYCSPILVEHGKTRLIVTMTATSIIGVDADNGTFYWRHPHRTDYDIHANSPIYNNGYIYYVSGYGSGGALLQLSSDGKSIKEIWRNKELDSQIGAAVLVNGYIYGSGHNTRKWQCLDFKTGKIIYTSDKRGKGNIISADGMLYCYEESGQVLLLKADPTAYSQVSSFKVTLGTDQHWAHLVIKNGRLYVRHGDALMVYDIKR